MSRALAALAAVAALVAGCTERAAEPAPEPAASVPATSAAESVPERRPQAVVTVLDGDTLRRVAGAAVSVGGREGQADGRGVAALELEARVRLRVRISAPGYVERELRLDFRDRRRYTVRIYRRDSQWPLFGATPGRTQAHPAIRLRPPFRVVWARGLGSLVEFPAVVWEGVAYVNTLKGLLYAVSMGDGEILWRRRVGTKTASSPAVDPESRTLVVTTMEPGNVQVRDLDTGRLRWRHETGIAEPSPVVADGVAYLADTDGSVYALDLRGRELLWEFSGGSKITSSPALAGGRLYVGDYAGNVYALDAESGRVLWTGSAGGKVYGTVAVSGGRVFVPAVAPGLSALDAETGALLWRIPTSTYLYSAPAVYRGRVYFGTYGGTVSAASAATGAVLWSRDAGGSVSGAVQVVAGVVYAGSFGDRITGWDWRTGRELFRFPHGQYVPVSGNGGRLLLHGYSRIFAVVSCRAAACP